MRAGICPVPGCSSISHGSTLIILREETPFYWLLVSEGCKLHPTFASLHLFSFGTFCSPFPSVFAVKSKTGALEGPEVDGFVKDMMGLVRVSYFYLQTCCVLHSSQ